MSLEDLFILSDKYVLFICSRNKKHVDTFVSVCFLCLRNTLYIFVKKEYFNCPSDVLIYYFIINFSCCVKNSNKTFSKQSLNDWLILV
jgi:hypothetical protein